MTADPEAEVMVPGRPIMHMKVVRSLIRGIPIATRSTGGR